MPICPSCRTGYEVAEGSCPQCGVLLPERPLAAPRERLEFSEGPGGLQTYSLIVGRVISVLGMFAQVIAAIYWLSQGRVLLAGLCLVVGAPYSWAMATLFRKAMERP